MGADFATLRAQVTEAGCMERRPWYSWFSLGRELGLAVGCWWGAAGLPWWGGWPLFALGSVFFYRNGFVMHDAAHGGVYGKKAEDHRLAWVAAVVLGEFLSGWRFGHNRHHAWPNVQGRDGDQAERWDVSRRYRSWGGALVELFFLNRLGWVRIPKSMLLMGIRDGFYAKHANPAGFSGELVGVGLSQVGQLGFFCWLFGGFGVLFWLFHLHVGLVYLNAVFAGNHYDREFFTEAEAGELSFVELQTRTARNYRAGGLLRFFLGGMENQIEHHLFPTMSRYQLSRAAQVVRPWCEAVGLPYEVLPFFESLGRVIRFHRVNLG